MFKDKMGAYFQTILLIVYLAASPVLAGQQVIFYKSSLYFQLCKSFSVLGMQPDFTLKDFEIFNQHCCIQYEKLKTKAVLNHILKFKV